MSVNHHFVVSISGLLLVLSVALSSATWCNQLPADADRNTPCFLQTSPYNPARLRSAGSTLVLPCHVARSKRSTVEWWYQDFADSVRIKIYPVFPAVRPTVLRFITSIKPLFEKSNETDISDASVILRNVNIDDSGIYQCVIRPWSAEPHNTREEKSYELTPDLATLSYHVTLSAPRLCQATMGSMPCFLSMRTSSPTIIDAYQSTFLQCLVQNHRRPTSVYWIAGEDVNNEPLISAHLGINQNKGDRLRRVFPVSQHDFSVELVINRDIHERSYSCVIAGVSDVETTLFTYIVRAINLDEVPAHERNNTQKVKTTTIVTEVTTTTASPKHESETHQPTLEKITPHDALSAEQIEQLREKDHHKHDQSKIHSGVEEVHQDQLLQPEETSTTI